MGKKLGGLIRAARTEAGLTQEQLARKVSGATRTEIGRFERGEAEPTTQVVKDIAKACGVTQKSLLDAMPKSQARTSSARTQSSRTNTGRTSTAQKSSMQVTATEKRLVELYRKADSETKKKALALLRGNEGETANANDILSGIGEMLGGLLFNSPQRSMAPLDDDTERDLSGELRHNATPPEDAAEPDGTDEA